LRALENLLNLPSIVRAVAWLVLSSVEFAR